jgi:starch-binding outer membrane protein SusE/F
MKLSLKILYVVLTGYFLVGCEDPALVTVNENVLPNNLNEPTSDAYVLVKPDAEEVMETFTWTATDFGFKASVTYKLQMDVAGNDFADPFELASTSGLSATIKVGAMNEGLLALGLTPEQAENIELRVVSSISSKVGTIISNVQTVSVTPYATSFPPIWGMGAALKGWGPWPDNAVELQSNEFKKYETITYFNNGEAFRFFEQLDWGPTSYNYPFFTSVDPLFENANDGDSNLRFIGSSGWYKINVNLVAKTVTMEAVSEPVLYMMGAALNGWGPWGSKEVKMTYKKPGVFEYNTNFTTTNETFRFFAQADWGPTSYNYPYFTTVDPVFENANDGDKNFRFLGNPGSYKVTVNLNEKTVTVGEPVLPKLFMMGAALNGWGPWNSKEVEMTYVSPGVYTATATFTANEAFRFFAQRDWGPTSYNYPYFTTVDALFANANDGDSNLKYVGTTGSVNIRVNLNTKVVSVE